MKRNRLNILWLALGLWLLGAAAQAENVDAAKAARERALAADAQAFAPEAWERAERALDKAYKAIDTTTTVTKATRPACRVIVHPLVRINVNVSPSTAGLTASLILGVQRPIL